MRLRYGLYDKQDEAPVYCCARCRGEIYYGSICFPIDGEQVLCKECHDEKGMSGAHIYAGTDLVGYYIKENPN